MDLTIRKKAEASASFLHFLKNETFCVRRDKTVGPDQTEHVPGKNFRSEKWKNIFVTEVKRGRGRQTCYQQTERQITNNREVRSGGKNPNETKIETRLPLTFLSD